MLCNIKYDLYYITVIGPVAQLKFFFLEPQPIFSKSYFSTSHKTIDPDSTCVDMGVIAQK